MIHVGFVEWLWLVINGTTLVLTLYAFREARKDYRAVKGINGRAREIAAAGSMRRESVRTVLQVLLLSFALPSLFSDREVTLSLPVLVLLGIAIGMFVNSALDLRDRREVIRILDKA